MRLCAHADGVGKFGWVVDERQALNESLPMPAAKQVKRSIYKFGSEDAEGQLVPLTDADLLTCVQQGSVHHMRPTDLGALTR